MVLVLTLPGLILSPTMLYAQPVGIPQLGDVTALELSPRVERRLGEAIMMDGRRDPTYIDDPAINQYLTDMGAELASHGTGLESVYVFAIRDPTVNAFAMPGGFIGIHSGLIVGARTESELAGVLAHEIAHVSQRHVARQLAQQSQGSMLLLGTMLAALAAAAAGAGGLAQGAAAFGQAAVVNSQLSFSRDAEREADRIGLTMLRASGYNPAGMASMFERLSQSARFNTGTGPSYASTHPMSIERMSDMQNRTREAGPGKRRESASFWFVRAKLMSLQAGFSRAVEPIAIMRGEAASQQGARKAAAYYGVALALLQSKDLAGARAAVRDAQAVGVDDPMLAQLEIDLASQESGSAAALQLAQAAVAQWPRHRGLALTQARLLQRSGRDQDAVAFLEEQVKRWPTEEPVLYRMLAESHARLGNSVDEKRNMAEYYVLTGALLAAVGQLQQARNATRDFYEQSMLDARIAEIQRRVEEDKKLLAEFRD